MNRQKKILAALLVGLALALVYAVWRFPRQERAVSVDRPPATATRAEGRAATPEAQLQVRLELLEPREETYEGYERNIFRFRPRPAAPRPTPAPPPAPETKPEPRPEPPPSIPEVGPTPVERELAKFTFLGFLQKGEEKTLFLRGSKDVFVVRTGDRFGEEGRFRVAEVTPQQMVIFQGEDPRPIVVPLVEQAPLAPRKDTPPGGVRPPGLPLRPPLPEPDAADDALSQEPTPEAPPPDFPWPHNAPGEVPND